MARGLEPGQAARGSLRHFAFALLLAALPVVRAEAGLLDLFGAASADEERRWLVYSGASVSENSYYFHSGARASLAGNIEQSGFIVAGASGAGLYRYASTTVPGGRIDGQFTLFEAFAGYQRVTPDLGVAVLAGVRVEDHRLSAPDPGNPINGSQAGFAGQVSLWAKPRPDILVTANASAADVFGGYYASASLGRRVPLGANVFAGVEGTVLGNRQYRQTRLGLHLTGIEIGAAQLGASAGFTRDRDTGNGGYGALSAWGRF